MRKLRSLITRAAVLTLLTATHSMPAGAAFLSGVRVHFISGPVSVASGQTATACASNPDDSPAAVLVALLQADNGTVVQTHQTTLQPGTDTCLSWVRQLQPNTPQSALNVYAVVVPNGRIDSAGRIVQDRPGGGCITASLQVQTPAVANVAGQTIVYSQMIKHNHRGDDD